MNAIRDRVCVVCLLTSLFVVHGCSSDMPFDLLPVEGKVTYDDGSLIEAHSVLLTFNPVNPERSKKLVAPGGQTYLKMEDGTFSGVTSRKPNDGIVPGRHKVVLVSFKEGANGFPTPSNAIPAIYRKVATTPVEVQVESSNQFIEIKVSKK
jgi:hypothetical protein